MQEAVAWLAYGGIVGTKPAAASHFWIKEEIWQLQQ
jgi:hypothetical protein